LATASTSDQLEINQQGLPHSTAAGLFPLSFDHTQSVRLEFRGRKNRVKGISKEKNGRTSGKS
ncbi:MAG: hypothetical protein ACI4OX_00810, partial [Akkermansia sp.]